MDVSITRLAFSNSYLHRDGTDPVSDMPDGVNRKEVAAILKGQGIPTMVYYEKPMHQQAAYRSYPRSDEALLVSEKLSRQVISLPMHPYLDRATQDHIIEGVRRAVGG